MAIDIATEKVISFPEARSNHIPARRAGKRVDLATLYRWTSAGCKGIVLESIMVGATRCTSVEALQRFFDALTAKAAAAGEVPEAIAPPPRKKDLRRRIESAKRGLSQKPISPHHAKARS